MTRCLRLAGACLLTLLCAAPSFAQQPQQQTEFVPVDSLPQAEQMPAAPLLIAAFVLVSFFVYLLSVARRMQKVQTEIERLEADMKKAGRG
jgi:cell division protein FtsL